MNSAELLIQCYENEGVTHAFGVPGEENADLLFALDKSKINFVMTRHEQAAAFIAEAYGKLTGNPALCISTLGPGATNLLTGIADANMDRAPIIAITAQGSLHRLHKESHQIINIEDMFTPVTKWSFAIRDGASIPEIVRKSIRLAKSEKPGAVVLELPEDIAGQKTAEIPLRVQRFHRPSVNMKVLSKAWTKLKQAKQPVIIAGNGAIRKRASKQLRHFCKLTNIGVISTFMGKGAVDKKDDYCLFTIGLSQKDIIAKAIDASDLVMTIGYDMVEYPPELWNCNRHTDIIHIDFLPAEIDKNYQPCIEVIGDIADSLEKLNDIVKNGLQDISYKFDVQRNVRQQMLRELEQDAQDASEKFVKPQKAIWDVRQALGPRDILISGVGAHKMWVARYYHCHEPNTCLIPNGFCSMGFALPGAIGAKIACPDRNVLAIVGDGDFLMNIQEMETAARLQTNITILIWEDKGYGLIEWKQNEDFGKHTNLSFGNPDWDTLARSFGWRFHKVRGSCNLLSSLNEALAYEGPSLLSIPIDYSENTRLSKKLGKIDVNI